LTGRQRVAVFFPVSMEELALRDVQTPGNVIGKNIFLANPE
jgi:hypothetical protein